MVVNYEIDLKYLSSSFVVMNQMFSNLYHVRSYRAYALLGESGNFHFKNFAPSSTENFQPGEKN